MFRFLPDEHFEKLRPLLQEEQYEFGDLIVRQGDPADAFYILTSGRRARGQDGSKNGERNRARDFASRATAFGEAALSEGGTRTATVRCSTAVEVLRLDRADFLAAGRKVPELKHHVEMTRGIGRCTVFFTSSAISAACRCRRCAA